MRVIETCISEEKNTIEENILEIFEFPVLKPWARVKKGVQTAKTSGLLRPQERYMNIPTFPRMKGDT